MCTVKTYKVLNMNCNHCVANISKALKGISGVDDVAFNLSNKTVKISGNISSDVVIKAISDAGYDVEV